MSILLSTIHIFLFVPRLFVAFFVVKKYLFYQVRLSPLDSMFSFLFTSVNLFGLIVAVGWGNFSKPLRRIGTV